MFHGFVKGDMNTSSSLRDAISRQTHQDPETSVRSQQQQREREVRKQHEREQRRRYEEMEQLRREEERRHAEREQVSTHTHTHSFEQLIQKSVLLNPNLLTTVCFRVSYSAIVNMLNFIIFLVSEQICSWRDVAEKLAMFRLAFKL